MVFFRCLIIGRWIYSFENNSLTFRAHIRRYMRAFLQFIKIILKENSGIRGPTEF